MDEDILKKYLATLGLTIDVLYDAEAPKKVKEAYRDLIKVWHPDRFSHDPKLQSKAQEKLRQINEAYQKIQDYLNIDKKQPSEESLIIPCYKCGVKNSVPQAMLHMHPRCGNCKSRLLQSASFHHGTISRPRPWVRFWARLFDLSVLGILLTVVFRFVCPEFTSDMEERHPLCLKLVILPFYFAVEAFIISIFGNTPGKALLRTKITNLEGKYLSFQEAIERGYYVYFVGLGLGLPIISLFTMAIAHQKLKEQGKTTWDKKFNFTVSHSHIGSARVAVFIICILVIILGDIAGDITNKNQQLQQYQGKSSWLPKTSPDTPAPQWNPDGLQRDIRIREYYRQESTDPHSWEPETSPEPQISERMQDKQSSTIASERFYEILTEKVPNWRQINEDPDFFKWTKAYDYRTRRIRYEHIKEATKRGDAETVATYFIFYKQYLEQEARKSKSQTH